MSWLTLRFLTIFTGISLFVVYQVLGQVKLELPVDDQRQRLENGEKEYKKIRRHAENSDCWEEAISRLQDGCNQLTDIEQSRMAIAFANCHLSKSALETYPCDDDQTIEECTKDMAKSILAFNTYTEFYTHTSDICFYLHSKIWQKRTEETVNRLTTSSKEVADQLEVSLAKQQKVLESQNNSLSNQNKMMENEVYLKNALNSSAENAKEAFLEIKTTTTEQKALLMQTFESLFKSVNQTMKIQSMLLGQSITLHSYGFYLVSFLACYIITNSPQTGAVRLWLFTALLIYILIQGIVVGWSVNEQNGTTTDVLYGRMWYCRNSFLLTSIVILFYWAWKYCYYARVDYTMLRNIEKEFDKLNGKIDKIGNHPPPSMPPDPQHD